jgi:phenylpropionate dioxygenase-like ring-hydroxylating dioxygenase large terminal subunit
MAYTRAIAPPRLHENMEFLRHFWHPVSTLAELEATTGGRGPLAIRLLGEQLVIAQLGSKVVAMRDRCAHRSARLSLGAIADETLVCPYHGWRYDAKGACSHIPACPNIAIPARARVESFECEVRYDHVWVRLDSSFGITKVPFCSAWDNHRFRAVVGEPYLWKTSAARRWENFTDLSHFAFVHPFTLFDPNFPEPPLVDIDRVHGQLRFQYSPPAEMALRIDKQANMGPAYYRCSMPFSVNLEHELFSDKTRTVLWMTVSPVDDQTCRSFFIFGRERDREGPDAPYLEFQQRVLGEDKPIIESQDPPEIVLDELGVTTDKVSIQYRRWLRELEAAARDGREAFAGCLYSEQIESSFPYEDAPHVSIGERV